MKMSLDLIYCKRGSNNSTCLTKTIELLSCKKSKANKNYSFILDWISILSLLSHEAYFQIRLPREDGRVFFPQRHGSSAFVKSDLQFSQLRHVHLTFGFLVCVRVHADLINTEECKSEEAWQGGEESSSELEDEDEQRQNSEAEEEEEDEEEEEGEHTQDDTHNHMVS